MSPHSTLQSQEMADDAMDHDSPAVSWADSDEEREPSKAVSSVAVPVPAVDVDMEDAAEADELSLPQPKRDIKDEIFSDDDEVDLVNVPAKSDGAVPPSSPPLKQELLTQASAFDDPDVMYAFYARLFPFRPFFHWLNHSPVPCPEFTHREFAYSFSNGGYVRYQAYPSVDLMKADLLRQNPIRFEIGPQYNTNPRDRKALGNRLKPVMKELVFDIDMTDYDDIRTCCSGASICGKCWSFITMAIKVVDVALRDDFGFEHILWVYSGRRGAHAWVCDKRARTMDDARRKAVVSYLELLRGQGGKRVNAKRPFHPHITRSLEILRPYFQNTILRDQDPWRSPEGSQKLLALIPDRQLRDALSKKWDAAPERTSSAKWGDIDALAKSGASQTLDSKLLLEAKQDILLEYTYPRLDAEVSKKLNHLLKSPFVVHPGTGRVCVPICVAGNMAAAEKFDPLAVPTVTELLGEIDVFQTQEGQKIQDWEKTRLKGYVEVFRGFVKNLMEGSVKKEDGMEF